MVNPNKNNIKNLENCYLLFQKLYEMKLQFLFTAMAHWLRFNDEEGTFKPNKILSLTENGNWCLCIYHAVFF